MQTYSNVYDNYDQAVRTVHDLESAGVPSSEISIIANKNANGRYVDPDELSPTATGASVGAVIGSGVGLLAGLGLLTIPGVGPVVAAGWLATVAVGAVAGTATGGVIGALIAAGASEQDAHVYSEIIRRGGTLVTVRMEKSTADIRDIMDRHGPIDTAARRKEYEESGWVSFDPNSPVYSPSEPEEERMRRRA
jgi:hypothetical protein